MTNIKFVETASAAFGGLLLTIFVGAAAFQPVAVESEGKQIAQFEPTRTDIVEALVELNETAEWDTAEQINATRQRLSELYTIAQ